MTDRIFKIYGTASQGASISLAVNAHEEYRGPIDPEQTDPFNEYGTEIYTFKSDVRAHGYTKIKLTCITGSIIVGRTKVVYPAKITYQGVTATGKLYIPQPIPDPKYLVQINGQLQTKDDSDYLTGEYHYSLVEGDVFEYYHLHLNGPELWILPGLESFYYKFTETGIAKLSDFPRVTPWCGYDNKSFYPEEIKNLQILADLDYKGT